MATHPWCAALKCPAPPDCEGYISQNRNNQRAQNFVACCKILCGTSAQRNLLAPWLALECGGATPATAWGIFLYLFCLVAAGCYIIAAGPFRKMKWLTYFVIAFASLVFNTGTGVFVTYVTSPFRVLQSLPAVGAMNVAVFFYYFSGFQYALGLAYEGAPLFVFINTAYTIGKVIPLDVKGPMFHANRIAIAMLVVAGLWILHSISYRLFGYRVDWRLEYIDPDPNQQPRQQLNPLFHMGAAQGHPTWRTPMGQSSSAILTGLAWWVLALVVQDLDNQGCRQDWFFYLLLCMAPILISLSVVWNVLNATRSKTIHLQAQRPERSSTRLFPAIIEAVYGWMFLPNSATEDAPLWITLEADYPGSKPYRDLWKHWGARGGLRDWNGRVREAYVQAVALQRMGRNSMNVEIVPLKRLKRTDKIVGFTAWLLAQLGLLMSFPAFFLLMFVSDLCGSLFERCHWTRLVETIVEDVDQSSLAEEVDQCFVGRDLRGDPMSYQDMTALFETEGTCRTRNLDTDVLKELNTRPMVNLDTRRMVNLHTLLDSTGPAELYTLGIRIRRA